MISILYVEDNEDNAYTLKLRLELTGDFGVTVAEDAETAFDLVAAAPPDLILMDLELPGMDGWAATRRLKSDPATRAIPVVALTAHALAGMRERALAAGCDEFETKPVDFPRLVDTIRRMLGARS